MLAKILYVLACIVLPVLWGAAINWLFDLWQSRTNGQQEDEAIFPDYQI